MSSNLQTYEVTVRVKGNPTEFWDGKYLHRYKIGKLLQMFHIEARTHKIAKERAKRYGYPIAVRKANVDRIKGNIENLKLDQGENPYPTAISMDEMIWQKRNIRRNNLHRDKETIDSIDEKC